MGPAKVAVLCWLLAGCCLGPVPCSRAAIVGVGDLAFVGYNSDGDDDFALVLLADAEAGTVIRFSDKEWQGTAFNTGEGGATWTATSPISAGTVVSFSDVDNVSNPGFGASSGTLSNALQFATGAETLYAFLGSDINTPVTFLAAISNSAGDYNGAQGTLAGTGLTLGTTAVLLPSGTRGGKYTGPRTGATNLAGYLPQIGNVASQWTTNTSNGELLVPFSLETFTTVLPPAPGPTPQVVAEPNSSISWAGVGAIAFVLQCLRRQRRCTVLPHRVATR